MTAATIRIFALLFAILCCASGPDAWSGSAAANRKELQRVKREMREKKTKLTQAAREERSILAELEKLDRDIRRQQDRLRMQRSRLRKAEADLRTVERSSAGATKDLDEGQQRYAQRLRTLYTIKRFGHDAPVFAFAEQSDAVRQARYLGDFVARDLTLLGEHGARLERLAARQSDIEKKRQDIIVGKRLVELREASLAAQRKTKSRLLTGIKDKKGAYEQTLRELEKSSAGLWAMIRKDELKRKALRDTRNARKRGASAAGRALLPWPLKGELLTHFGLQRHPEYGTMVFRRGIEIKADEGEPVRAVKNGEVAFADWYQGYGKLMILDHGGGFYTLYGNLSQILAAAGDEVEKGQVIGRTGDTDNLKGARLYFEVRNNGEAQDPLSWLAQK